MSAAPIPLSQRLPRQRRRNAIHDIGGYYSYNLERLIGALGALELHLSVVVEPDSYHIPAIGAFEVAAPAAPGYLQRAIPHVLYRLW